MAGGGQAGGRRRAQEVGRRVRELGLEFARVQCAGSTARRVSPGMVSPSMVTMPWACERMLSSSVPLRVRTWISSPVRSAAPLVARARVRVEAARAEAAEAELRGQLEAQRADSQEAARAAEARR